MPRMRRILRQDLAESWEALGPLSQMYYEKEENDGERGGASDIA